jgi:Nucleotide modification associated domain 3
VEEGGGSLAPTHADEEKRLRYAPRRERVQAIWAYLKIGAVLSVYDTPEPPSWARSHPHFEYRDQARFAKQNTVYVAADRVDLGRQLPGAGVLGPYRPPLRLTRVGCTPSVWDLPIGFHPSRTKSPMTGNPESSWAIVEDRAVLRAARIGQEFVVEVNDEIEAWLAEIMAVRDDDVDPSSWKV